MTVLRQQALNFHAALSVNWALQLPSGAAEPARLSHAECRGPAVAALQIAIAGQRPKRKKLRISMVAQIEHARETRGGMVGLAPETIVALRRGEIGDAARDCGVIGFTRGHQSKQSPCRLRSGAGRGFVTSVVQLVACRALAPAAVRILDPLKPRNRAAHRLRLRILTRDCERAQRRPGSIDVVHAPAAEPASVPLLVGQKSVD